MNAEQTEGAVIRLPRLSSTTQLATLMASRLRPGQFLALSGELGAGKTTFTRELTKALGCRQLATSPTFSLFQEYEGGRLPVFHADLYRLGSEDELFELGWEEYLENFSEGLVVVEWADKFPHSWPSDTLWLQASFGLDDESRELHLSAEGSLSEGLLRELLSAWGEL